jgi:tetratricopeptide (TPR) repeat protein
LGIPLGLVVILGSLFLLRPAENPDQIWRKAEDDFRAGRWDRAEEGLARLSRARAPTGQDWILRAQIAMARERSDEALTSLAKIQDGHPFAPQARLLSGQLELRRDRIDRAEGLLRQAVNLDPKLIAAWRELIYIYGVRLQRQKLSDSFLALASLTPLTYDDVFVWCLTRGVKWDPAEQVKTLDRFLKADPDDRLSRLALSENLQALGRLDDALKCLTALSDADPDARAMRARLAIDRGDLASASSLLASGPEKHSGLARLRGRMALLHKDSKEAMRQFEIADEAEPNQRDTLSGLATAARMAGDNETAERYGKRTREHDALSALLQRAATAEGRADPRLPLQLGEACAAISRNDEARAWIKVAVQRDPLNREAQQALHRIPETGPAGN